VWLHEGDAQHRFGRERCAAALALGHVGPPPARPRHHAPHLAEKIWSPRSLGRRTAVPTYAVSRAISSRGFSRSLSPAALGFGGLPALGKTHSAGLVDRGHPVALLGVSV